MALTFWIAYTIGFFPAFIFFFLLSFQTLKACWLLLYVYTEEKQKVKSDHLKMSNEMPRAPGIKGFYVSF